MSLFRLQLNPRLEKGSAKSDDTLSSCRTIVGPHLEVLLQLDEQCASGEMLVVREEPEKMERGSKWSCKV